eukprot:TRINITY_DN11006_c0_g1_i1.p1 TRINITY_DN11006_c0_g1~~TRINITY_DN11006_c0_g1_i1.p1  ORF type:complete len:267 (-),score=-9.24 TRINITY_DN11006_c0_g1_i1:282-1034(-)
MQVIRRQLLQELQNEESRVSQQVSSSETTGQRSYPVTVLLWFGIAVTMWMLLMFLIWTVKQACRSQQGQLDGQISDTLSGQEESPMQLIRLPSNMKVIIMPDKTEVKLGVSDNNSVNLNSFQSKGRRGGVFRFSTSTIAFSDSIESSLSSFPRGFHHPRLSGSLFSGREQQSLTTNNQNGNSAHNQGRENRQIYRSESLPLSRRIIGRVIRHNRVYSTSYCYSQDNSDHFCTFFKQNCNILPQSRVHLKF